MTAGDYASDLKRLAQLAGDPDADLAVVETAARHGKTEDAVLADLDEQHGGAVVLAETRAFIRRFCAFPDEHALVAVTLWSAHSHMVEHFHTTPRLALLSPEPASGKTRVLEVLDLLVSEPMLSISASPAAIFRTLSDRQVTLLFDEVDAIWSRRGKDDNHEDLRALLNAGYKRGASIPRCVGPKHDIVHFAVHCAVALAGLGEMPDTVMSRSVIIRMRRRRPDEQVEQFRTRMHEPEGHVLRDRLSAWAGKVGHTAGADWPELPDGVVDRPAEVWEPLIAVADVAGGDWPARARAACVELCKVAEDRRVSLGIRLLSDLQIMFDDNDAMHTETILERLHNGDGLDDDAPWGDLRGKPLSVRGLASMLKPYGVHSMKVKVHGKALQGYRREHLYDAWQRYLSPVPAEVEPMEPAEQMQSGRGFPAGSAGSGTKNDVEPVEPAQAVDNAGQVPKVPQVPETRTPERGKEYLL